MGNEFDHFDPTLDALFGDLEPEERAEAEASYRHAALPWCERVTVDHPVRRGRPKLLRRWPPERLQWLFEAFRTRFWPGQLEGWRVETRYISDEARAIAFCDVELKDRIVIDLTRHRSDRDVRETLLHEMCHAAVPASRGHDLLFFQQVERLLAQGVRVGIHWRRYREEADADLVRTTLPRCAARASRNSGDSRPPPPWW